MTSGIAPVWLPVSVINDIDALLEDSAPHAIVLGRVGYDRSSVAQLLARRMAGQATAVTSDGATAATDSLQVLVLEGDELEDTAGTERARDLAARGARLVLVPHGGMDTIPTDLRLTSAVLRLRPWDEQDIAAFLEHRRECEPDAGLVHSLAGMTGGHPAHVRHFVAVGDDHHDADQHDADLLDPALWAQSLDRQMTTLGDGARGLVEELAVGFRVHGTPPAPCLVNAEHPERLVDALDEHGLLGADGELVPLVETTVRHRMPTHRLLRIGREVVDGIEDPAPHAEVICEMIADGVRCERLTTITRDLGDADLVEAPEQALAWYDRCEQSGMPPEQLAARRAEAHLRAGDVAAAAHTADLVLASGDSPELGRAVSTAVAAHVERGLVSQARELALWAKAAMDTVRDIDLTTVCAAAGTPATDEGALAGAHHTGAPTLARIASTTACEGVHSSLTSEIADAVNELVKAAHLMPPDRSVISPFPLSLVAGWAALNAGDPATAAAVAGRARLSAGPHAVRRDLLLGWASMWQGRLEEARGHADRAAAEVHDSQLRNRLVLAGLRAGIARRTTDEEGTVRAWQEASECLGRTEPDLFMLLALGELDLAAVRVRQSEALAADLEGAHRLLTRLGSPPLWSTPLHWSSVQAAILADRPSGVAPHASALAHAAADHPFAARLAAAGKAWMHVLARAIDPAEVRAAALGLAEVAQAWDGARLAAHAAARCDDPRESAGLREVARRLRGTDEGDGTEPTLEAVPGSVLLSERELEVVRLVLDGKTYREVGAMLFLSPRTVEHHMARIRRRSEAASRSELLERLLFTVRQMNS